MTQIMLKTALFSVGIICAGVGMPVSDVSAALQMERVVPTPRPAPKILQQVDYETPLKKALDAHNLMNMLPQIQDNQAQTQRTQEQFKHNKRQMEALDKCNIARLEKFFKNPDKVWNKMKERYESDEKQLAIYLNSSLSPENQKDEAGKASQDMTEMFMYWSLGQKILTDVYQNPEQWGEPHQKNSAVFPLWQDQKYLVADAFDNKYTELNAFFGVPLNGRPLIGESKFDYKHYDEVVMAHDAYVAALIAAKPERALLLPDKLKQPPEVAPRPLPPLDESVIYLKNQDGTTTFFPSVPAPWQEFQDSGFKKYNKTGEMAQDFVGKGFQVKDAVSQRDPQVMNRNRLEVFQALKKQMSGAQKAADIAEEQAQQEMIQLVEGLNQLNIQLPEEPLDLLKSEHYQTIFQQLGQQKVSFLAEATQALTQNEAMPQPKNDAIPAAQFYFEAKEKLSPEKADIYQKYKEISSLTPFQQGRRLIDALTVDAEGSVFLRNENAGDIANLMNQAKAAQTLRSEVKIHQEEYDEKFKKSKKIDAACLNQGDMF